MFDNWVIKYVMLYSINGKYWFMVIDRWKDNGSLRVSVVVNYVRIIKKF